MEKIRDDNRFFFKFLIRMQLKLNKKHETLELLHYHFDFTYIHQQISSPFFFFE